MNIKPKTKLKAIGCKKVSNIDLQILNAKSIKIFNDPHPQNIRKNHGAQYFSNFLDGLRNSPNEAKWSEDKYLVLIEILPITTKEYDIDLIKTAFEAFYLNINIVLFEEKLTIVKEKNIFYLRNKKYEVDMPVLSFHNAEGEKLNLSSNNIIKAQRLLLKNYFKQT